MTGPADNRLQARNDLAWAISVGGIGVVLFAALLAFTWHFAATLFLSGTSLLSLSYAAITFTVLLGAGSNRTRINPRLSEDLPALLLGHARQRVGRQEGESPERASERVP